MKYRKICAFLPDGPKTAGINGVITSINGYYKWVAKGYNPTKNELFRPIYSDRKNPPCVKSVCFFGMSSRDLLEKLVFQ